MRAHVLSIGQCTPDDANLARVLALEADAHLDRAPTAEAARKMLSERQYDLVLLNRILDADGSSGVELIAEFAGEPNMPPLMLVSNFPEAQAQAVASGALMGFGKAALHTPETAQLLRQTLHSESKAGT